MGKVIAILGGCLAVAAGGAYGLHCCDPVDDPANCPLYGTPCCPLAISCCTASDDGSSSAMAVAGPVALFATVPASAEIHPCCEAPARADLVRTAASHQPAKSE